MKEKENKKAAVYRKLLRPDPFCSARWTEMKRIDFFS